MNQRTILGIFLFGSITTASTSSAQSDPSALIPILSLTVPAATPTESTPKLSLPPPKPVCISRTPVSAGHFSKAKFILLSTAVYGASLADMHQTFAVRNLSWWYETDPLARPFVHLPAPAYYVTGLAMATGINWLSWRMAHSGRWHKLAPIPQLLTIGGNLYGYHSNRY
jgi:hypothetical protein